MARLLTIALHVAFATIRLFTQLQNSWIRHNKEPEEPGPILKHMRDIQMKKLNMTLAALAALTVGSAYAATFSGQVQVGVYSPIDSTKSATVDELSGARTYLTVTEEANVADGLKVGAMVQARFSPATGADRYSDGLFEQVKLDLTTDFGTVSFGKYNTLLGFGQSWVGVFSNDGALNSRIPSTDSRLVREIGYKTLVFSGFQAEVVIAAKDPSLTGANATAGSNGLGGKLYSGAIPSACPTTGCIETQNASQFNVTYVQGPVQAFLSFSDNNWGNKNKQYGIAYNFGVAKVMASQQANDASVWGESKRTYTSIGVQAPITPTLSVGYQRGQNDVTDETRQTLSAEYYWNKSTKLIFDVGQNNNRTESTSAAANAAANGTGYFLGFSYAF